MSEQNSKNNSPKWNNNFSFLMAVIGAAVGLGNIWRFSYILYSNGGGAFFIPYIIAILILAVPFLFMEYALGVHFKDSLSNIFKKLNSRFEIFGWALVLMVFLVSVYYIIIIGWDMIYLILSFFKGWGSDPNVFFMNNMVVGSNNLNGFTTFVWPTVLATIVLWFVLWFISHKSLNDGLSKVVNVLTPLLFIIMAFIIVFSFTLPGMDRGIAVLLNPNWGILFDINIWLAAFGQIIFSLSMGQAIILTYASYLPENTKLTDNVIIVIIANCGFEICTALGVFSILGFMSLQSNIPVNQIATSGTGLLFIVFPKIFEAMGSFAYIIGPLFFMAVLFAGLTSALGLIEPLSSALSKKFSLSRKTAATIISISGFLLSLAFTTSTGTYLITVIDSFINQFGIMLLIIIQTIIFGWVFGVEKLIPVLNEFSTIKVGKIWVAVIKYALPIFLTIIWITGIIELYQSKAHQDGIIQLIITIFVIGVSLLLTKLPAKEEI